MRGQILEYNPATGEGIISAQDGKRYTFKGTEFRGQVTAIRPSAEVDFEAHEDGTATAVFPLAMPAPVYTKSKIAAGIFAIFLGGFGIHKFYLGYTTPGVILLLVSLLLWWLIFPIFIVGTIVLIEGIIYLTKTDEEFEEQYVRNKRQWF